MSGPRKRRIWPWIAAAAALLLFALSIPFLFAVVLAGRYRAEQAESRAATIAEREHALATLDEARTRNLDLGSEQLLRVNTALGDALREYEALEADHVRVTSTHPHDLQIEVEPFNDELESICARLGARLSLFLEDPAKSAEVMNQLLEQVPYGREKVLIRILREPDGGFQVFEARDGSQQPVFPREIEELPPEFLRFWRMAKMPPR